MKRFKKKHTVLCLFTFVVFPIWAQQSHDHQQQKTQVDRHRNRWLWQMPIRVMDEIGIKDGMTVADVGAGDGYFSFPISERVGKKGKVYASDIDNNALQVIRNRCKGNEFTNISVILGIEDDPLLPEKSTDFVLVVNTIHEVKNPTVFLKNISKSLKTGGYLVIIQWDAEKMNLASEGWDPDDQVKYSLRANLRKIYDADFEVVQIKDFLPMQKIFICQPSEKY